MSDLLVSAQGDNWRDGYGDNGLAPLVLARALESLKAADTCM